MQPNIYNISISGCLSQDYLNIYYIYKLIIQLVEFFIYYLNFQIYFAMNQHVFFIARISKIL